MDQDYVDARKQRAARVKRGGAGTGALEGGKALVGGVASGIGGLFYQPFKGAKNGGVGGFFAGLGKGVVGAVTKPVAGTLEAVSNTFEGISNSATNAGSDKKLNRKGIVRKRRILQGDERRIIPWHPLEGILRGHLELNQIIIDPDTRDTKLNTTKLKRVATLGGSTHSNAQEKYLFHLLIPNSKSLMFVITTKEIYLFGIHPNISEDNKPPLELMTLLNDGPTTSNKAKKNIKNSVKIFSIQILHYGNKVDPSETASTLYNNIVRRINHVHSKTGLTLSQMEHLLLQKLTHGDVSLLKKNMNKQELINYTGWNTTINKLKTILAPLNVLTNPFDGLKIIVDCITCVQNGIELAMNKNPSGADELTPTIIYLLANVGTDIIIKNRLLLCIRLIYVLSGPKMNGGKDEYCVSMFEGALTQLADTWKGEEMGKSSDDDY